MAARSVDNLSIARMVRPMLADSRGRETTRTICPTLSNPFGGLVHEALKVGHPDSTV